MGELTVKHSICHWSVSRLRGTSWLAHIKLMRPYAWLWFDALPVAGLYLLLSPAKPSWVTLLLTVFVCVLLDSAATTLNDIHDRMSDMLSTEPSRYLRPLVTGEVSISAAKIQVCILNFLAILCSTFLGLNFFLGALLVALLGFSYSAPPFRFNSRPQTSHIFWYLCGSAFYLLVAAAAKNLYSSGSLLWLAGYFCYYATGENFAKDLRDYDNDKASGKNTLIVKLGTQKSAFISFLGCCLGAGFYAAIIWTQFSSHFLLRILFTVLLVGALWANGRLCFSIMKSYSKVKSRALHRRFILYYLLFHLSLAALFLMEM